jgi:hypothetical protein
MKKIACQYAIVRFLPFVETGEFANVGIVLMAANQHFFGYKLETSRYGRITRFFEELDAKVYRGTIRNLREELERITGLLKGHGFDNRLKSNDVEFANAVFKEIVRARETIVRFSEVRKIVTADPKETLKELFEFYVERNFVTKKYQEEIMEQSVRNLLLKAHLGERFVKTAVGDEEYHANFPFVEQMGNKPVKIIKPLHLAHEDSTKILDHGGAWLFRINELKKRNLLPRKVLFAVSEPDNDGKRQKACQDIEDSLRETGSLVVPFSEKETVIEFAVS